MGAWDVGRLEARRLLAEPGVSFAVIGDYGYTAAGPSVAQVASLVKSWRPDLVLTAGDNNYPLGEASTIDVNIGQHYQELIGDYRGTYGAGPLDGVNRFFPSLGNHDWYVPEGLPGLPAPYLNYFTLPGNERYYDFVRGPVHFFAIDSDLNEPDGMTAESVQARWLKHSLAKSTSPWNIVYFHHAAYSSALHGPEPLMQWPFKEWGADAVLAGHDHSYERIIHPATGLPYFVSGLGGASIYPFINIQPGSRVRYNGDFGAMKVDATASRMTFQFISVGGQLIDSYTLTSGAAVPAAPANLSATAVSPTQVNLSWSDRAGDEGGHVVERAIGLGTFVTVAELGPDVTEFRDTGLAAETEYRYRVRAMNSLGPSPGSNVVSVSTPAGEAVTQAAPAFLFAVPFSDTRVDLVWQDVPGEDGYVLERSSDGVAFEEVATLPVGNIGYTFFGLAPATLHYFRVRAFGPAGDSDYVNDTSVTLPKGPRVDIVDVTPDPRNVPVEEVRFAFSQPVSGFDVSDLVLSRDGGPNLLGPDQAVELVGGSAYVLPGLEELTSLPGRYTLVLRGGGITDAESDSLEGGASEAWVMQTAVVAAPLAPDLELASDTGVSQTDNFTTDATPTITGVAPIGATVRLYANGREIDSAVAQEGTYRITSPELADGFWAISAKVFDAAGNASPHSLALTVVVDRASPRVEQIRFNGGAADAHTREISVTFSEPLAVKPTDLVLLNRTDGQIIDPAMYAMAYYPLATRATWTFPGLEGGLLPDGDYLALVSGTVVDAAGNSLDGNADGISGDAFTRAFFQLAGDANYDRVVDHRDFAVLRTHFGQAGAASQGDFTGDGVVDFADFQLLERRFGQKLADDPPAAAILQAAPKAKTKPKPVAPVRRAPVKQTFSRVRVVA